MPQSLEIIFLHMFHLPLESVLFASKVFLAFQAQCAININIAHIGDMREIKLDLFSPDASLQSFSHDGIVDRLDSIIPSILHIHYVPDHFRELIVPVNAFLVDHFQMSGNFVVILGNLSRVISFQGLWEVPDLCVSKLVALTQELNEIFPIFSLNIPDKFVADSIKPMSC